MPTFDPKHMRIIGHALRIMGTFLGNYRRYLGNLRIALWAKKIELFTYPYLLFSKLCRHNLPTPTYSGTYEWTHFLCKYLVDYFISFWKTNSDESASGFCCLAQFRLWNRDVSCSWSDCLLENVASWSFFSSRKPAAMNNRIINRPLSLEHMIQREHPIARLNFFPHLPHKTPACMVIGTLSIGISAQINSFLTWFTML